MSVTCRTHFALNLLRVFQGSSFSLNWTERSEQRSVFLRNIILKASFDKLFPIAKLCKLRIFVELGILDIEYKLFKLVDCVIPSNVYLPHSSILPVDIYAPCKFYSSVSIKKTLREIFKVPKKNHRKIT